MNFENYKTMDPHIFLSLVNARLRVRNNDLEDFCKENDIDQDELLGHMDKKGYTYNSNLNQFRER